MMVSIEALVTMTEANQSFSKVAHIVGESGPAVILKNSKPRYIMVGFEEYEAIKGIREAKEKKLEMTTDTLIEKNMEAFLELAK